MATYRSLLLGCGPRATEHVDVYREIPNMKMVACCDLLPERRENFRKKFGIEKTYDNYEKALAEVKPDIVHVVTSPGNRVWEVEVTAKAGVKAMIIEKPIAVMPSEIVKMDAIQARTGIKICANCQRRYFPQFRDRTIRDIVRDKIGDLYFVRASSKGNTMGMGPHQMDLLQFFLDEAQPGAVWAMAYGITEEGYQKTHRAPEHIFGQYWFPKGVRAFFECSTEALGTPGETSFWMHLHFDFLGSKGRLYLTQNKGYWWQSEGMAQPVRGESSWDKQGLAGQRDFTKAVADWLDGGEPHLNRWEVAKNVFNALIGMQQSVYEGRKVPLPHTFTDAQWTELRERLKRR
jgi:predicted dehydrogenase